MSLRLATRRSPLALTQARVVAARLSSLGVATEIVEVTTTGDQRRDAPLEEIGGQGVFAVEVQRMVLEGRADVAVHSAKDLPSLTPEGLVLAAVPERLDPADVMVGAPLAVLGPGARVATGSPRRRAMLLERRPDLVVVGLRGNMATRLAAVEGSEADAIVAAAAALQRLGMGELIAERLSPDWFVPQVGQGALALEARQGDEEALGLLARVDDATHHAALRAERAFQRELGVGCTIPAGATCVSVAGGLALHGAMVAVDGSSSVRDHVEGPDPDEIGARLARRLRDELGGESLPGWGT
jgi:hydroxymethylbilane synthase